MTSRHLSREQASRGRRRPPHTRAAGFLPASTRRPCEWQCPPSPAGNMVMTPSGEQQSPFSGHAGSGSATRTWGAPITMRKLASTEHDEAGEQWPPLLGLAASCGEASRAPPASGIMIATMRAATTFSVAASDDDGGFIYKTGEQRHDRSNEHQVG
ncbi:hypothetical protein Dimus_013425 [Dionaea muscipula]